MTRPWTTTLTGVDEGCTLSALRDVSEEHPVEWGILLGGREEPRYPSRPTLDFYAAHHKEYGLSMALHLCGAYAHAWIAGDAPIVDLARQFGRIQLNIIGRKVDPVHLRDQIQRQHSCVIIQQNAANAALNRSLLGTKGHMILFDSSGGRGVAPQSAWPAAWPDVRCGYAGGLGPENVAAQLAAIAQVAPPESWLDMEGRIRTPNDRLDLNACRTVLEAVQSFRQHQPAVQRPAPGV